MNRSGKGLQLVIGGTLDFLDGLGSLEHNISHFEALFNEEIQLEQIPTTSVAREE